MNISELSDMTAEVGTENGRSAQNKKRLVVIIVAAAILLAAALVGWSFLSRANNYERYVEGIMSNEGLFLQLEDGDTKLYNAFAYGVEFIVTHNPKDKRIQTQAIRASSSDSISFNLTYSYAYGEGGEPYYSVAISESDSEDRMKTVISIGARFTHGLELIGCSGDKDDGMTRLTDDEARAYFEAHRPEVADLLQKMYDFFGEEHFKE